MKKNIISKKIVSILLIAFLMITATNVYAANDSFETTINASATQAKRESTVTITLGLTNISIESGDKGIGGYTGNIKFDSSVLEYVSVSGTDKWDKPLYQDGLITATTSDGEVIKATQSIATITFKVKKDAKLGKTTITIENFSGSNGKDDLATDNKSTEITIISDSDSNDNSGNNGNSGSSDKLDNNNSNKDKNTSENKGDKLNVTNTSKENIKQGKLPKAGTNDGILFVVIVGCIVLSIVFYTRFKLIDSKIKSNK